MIFPNTTGRFTDMENTPSWLMPLLRSRIQGDLLALLYLHPDQDYMLSEVAAIIGASVKAVHTEANRLVKSGLVTDTRRGNSRLLRANSETPVYQQLADLLAVTYGPLPVLTEMLRGVEGVQSAYIFGSWAARYTGTAGDMPHDVDVLVVGTTDMARLYEIADDAQRRLRREINIHRARPGNWADPAGKDPFLATVRSRPMVELKVIA